ncbi:MAG: family oxidoreductase [Cyanobacteria bacterium RYN_339]|nr:family oxidoreductase [Cyanobacteria bacterium RYN_339]
MIIQAKDVTGDRREEADVVIIGSGAGGGTMANELTAAGLKVVILEEGKYQTREDFHQREDKAFSRIYGGRGLESSEDTSVNVLYGKLVGGTTVLYWGDSYRTPPERLAKWGFDEATMAPFFDHVEKLVNVQLPGDRLVNENNRLLVEGARKLGWKVEKIPGARTEACTNSGHCLQGCSYDAKQSQLVTNIPRALSRGAVLYADCRARKLIVENGRAVGVEATIGSAKLTVRSKAVVLSAGGVGTPRFLLSAGQANSSGMVGKNLYLNPGPMTFSAFPEAVRMWHGVPATWAVEEFRKTVYDPQGRYVRGGYLLMANNLQPGTAGCVIPGFGAKHRAWMARFEHLAGTYAILDDENPGELTVDAAGKPAFNYTVRGNDVLKCRDFLANSARLMLAAGAEEVLIPDSRFTTIRKASEVDAKIAEADLSPGSMVFGGPHPLGTCRMGEDAKTSVVDMRCESHDLKGLFVADGSIFPTSVGVDPSLSIMAFAARTATYVVASLT